MAALQQNYAVQQHQQQSPVDDSTLSRPQNDSPAEDWSGDESGGNDGRKRKRPMSVSCELCKQRKVKCDRGQPSCGWCARNSQLCEYKERKKPGLRAGYGRELEARLDRLEALIQTQQATINQLTGNSSPMPPSTATPHSQPTVAEANIFATPHAMHPIEAYNREMNTDNRHGLTHTIANNARLQAEYAAATTSPMTDLRNNSMIEGNGSGVGGSGGPAMRVEGQGSGGLVNGGEGGNGFTSHGGNYMAQSSYQRPDGSGAASQNNGQPYFQPAGSLNSSGLSPAPQSLQRQSARQHKAGTQDHELPPYDLLYGLCDLYFKHVNTWCPILHRRNTLDALFGSSASLDEADRIILHAFVATTLRFSTDPRLTPEKKEMYHSLSKQKVLLYGLENSSVKALQALVILALDMVGISNGPPGWNLLALITRSAVQLGLSVETSAQIVAPSYPSIYTLRAITLPEPANWIEDESRRRLFWMVYILDRYATITTAFDFALDEKEIERRLPCRDDLFSRNTSVETRWFRHYELMDRPPDRMDNLGSFSFYVEIVGILSRIHQFLKKPVDITSLEDVERWQAEYRHLDDVLTSWKNNVPKDYGNVARLGENPSSKIANCGWVMLHATFHTTTIRLHSSAAYPTTRSPIFMPSYNAGQRCLQAVNQLSELCEHVRVNNMTNKLGPPFAFSMWVAARLLLVHSSTIEHQINPKIYIFLGTLQALGEFWAVAGRYASLLQRVLDEFSESQRQIQAGKGGERVTPSSVRILADMRRCAFDLDFLISRAPRQTQGASAMTSEAALDAPVQSNPNTMQPRVPAANELEYLDVFDFFNMPRLPIAQGDSNQQQTQNNQPFGVAQEHGQQQAAVNDGFNITNFAVDASADWFSKTQP